MRLVFCNGVCGRAEQERSQHWNVAQGWGIFVLGVVDQAPHEATDDDRLLIT